MRVKIYSIGNVNSADIRNWKDGNLFIDLEMEEFLSREEVKMWYDQTVAALGQDNSTYTFDSFCKENKVFNIWDFNYLFGENDWGWEVIDTYIVKIFVIAVKC